MTVQNAIDLAASTKLKNIAVAKDTAAVLGYLNLGITELHKRFPLRVDEAIITLRDNKTEYKVDGTDPDVSMPANSQFMWLVSAYQEVEDTETTEFDTVLMPVNEEDNPMSLQTVAWNTVQIPLSRTGAYVSLIYVAAPAYYTVDNLTEQLPLPPQMVEPLLEYMAYQAKSSIGTIQDTALAYQEFEASCSRVEMRGMITSDDLEMLGRDLKGFV